MIDWKQADLQVFKLQKRIYRATQKQELGEVVMQKNLILAHLYCYDQIHA